MLNWMRTLRSSGLQLPALLLCVFALVVSTVSLASHEAGASSPLSLSSSRHDTVQALVEHPGASLRASGAEPSSKHGPNSGAAIAPAGTPRLGDRWAFRSAQWAPAPALRADLLPHKRARAPPLTASATS